MTKLASMSGMGITLCLFLCMLSCGERPASQGKSGHGFAYQITTDATTGWEVVTLTYTSPNKATQSKQVKIAPQAGANLYSFTVGEQELLVAPPTLQALRGYQYGMPILYPTPNRVRDGVLKYANLELKFTPNDGPDFNQGLVNQLSWNYNQPEITKLGVKLKTWLDFEPGQPWFTQFPLKHRLSLEFLLQADGVQIQFRVTNNDTVPIPFGFGVQPWFKISGALQKWLVKIPAWQRMEVVNALPTGKLLPMHVDPALDLRNYVSLSNLNLDAVFWGMTPLKPATLRDLDRNLQLNLHTSSDFTHITLHAAPAQAAFSLGNQTSAPDAHNLAQKGLLSASHLLTVEPESYIEGYIKYVVQ
ncbi:aldose 1-epimerase [candidate division KSB1 bacterium]|nr:aldose 1-epimerase [candidate division KSB1 bacterium]